MSLFLVGNSFKQTTRFSNLLYHEVQWSSNSLYLWNSCDEIRIFSKTLNYKYVFWGRGNKIKGFKT